MPGNLLLTGELNISDLDGHSRTKINKISLVLRHVKIEDRDILTKMFKCSFLIHECDKSAARWLPRLKLELTSEHLLEQLYQQIDRYATRLDEHEKTISKHL